jgi:hypothetical protein
LSEAFDGGALDAFYATGRSGLRRARLGLPWSAIAGRF